MPSGKTMWLCPEHQQMSRVAVLTDDVTLTTSGGALHNHDEGMLHELSRVAPLYSIPGQKLIIAISRSEVNYT